MVARLGDSPACRPGALLSQVRAGGGGWSTTFVRYAAPGARALLSQSAVFGARRAGRNALSVPPTCHAERESRAAKGDAGARLDRRRPGLAGQGDEPAADGLEPAAPGDPAASQAGSSAGGG